MSDVESKFLAAIADHQAGRTNEAEAGYRAVLAAEPFHAPALHLLGIIELAAGRVAEAAQLLRDSLRLDRSRPLLHVQLAEAYHRLGDLDRAVDCCRVALAMEPGLIPAQFQLGRTLRQQGRLGEAVAALGRVVAEQPLNALAQNELACAYYEQARLTEAIAAARAAIEAEPYYSEAYNTLTVALNDAEQSEAAIETARRAVTMFPDYAPLHANLASALQAQGRADLAIAERMAAVRLQPNDAEQHSNLLYALNLNPELTPAAIFAEHCAWSLRHADPLTLESAGHELDRSPERRLRVGYVSPFFRQHAVNFFIEPLLMAHDRTQVELFCYSDHQGGDETTQRLKARADMWREIAYRPDAEVAQRIRDDRIDILVDLPGHIGGNRLQVFARKPAPVQVTYLGYQNTTGMRAMDYRLTDGWADPEGQTDAYYTERLIRLPGAFFVYQPLDDAPSISPLPAMSHGYVTFGSFNNYMKVTSQVVETWLELLKRVENSRLVVLAYSGGQVARRWRAGALHVGIDPQRITLVDKRPHAAYMELIGQVDIGLDPFPFNGHTTTCDSVWMGVPVVMLAGQTYASRFGGSVHCNLGLEGWIAHSQSEYVEIAADWAGRLAELAALRGQLRARMAASPLMDFAGFARNVEAAYRHMWRNWCLRA